MINEEQLKTLAREIGIITSEHIAKKLAPMENRLRELEADLSNDRKRAALDYETLLDRVKGLEVK